jgi:hypothetical protein
LADHQARRLLCFSSAVVLPRPDRSGAGSRKVTYATWFSGVYIDKKQFFARLAVDSETFFDGYPEFVIEKDEFEVFKREGNAAIIGTDIAERYNLKLGDIMPTTPGLSAMNLELWWISGDDRLRQIGVSWMH